MYGIQLPPEQLRRLHSLRERFRLGSIKAQVVNAVEDYLERKEKLHGIGADPPGKDARRADDAR